ncbi:uncharacterized protein [Desmodus rotundus]|uniref:uncharacterized protein n=1 Tax=Desmodus rotundus TaxID=9430 RepID=UPI0023817249|nr:uncharacterized protein LOC128779416 [Desmodus rotundus]
MQCRGNFSSGKGGGESLKQPPRRGARQVLPGGAFSFFLPSSCFLRLCSQSHFQRLRRTTLHFSPGFSQGPGWRRGRGWRRGLRAALRAGLREQRLLGRPSPLHVGGRWSAGLGRTGHRARSPHTRTAAARRDSRRPGAGVLFGIQRTRAAAAAAAALAAPAATSPCGSHPRGQIRQTCTHYHPSHKRVNAKDSIPHLYSQKLPYVEHRVFSGTILAAACLSPAKAGFTPLEQRPIFLSPW